MTKRYLPILAIAVSMLAAGTPALATDEPPPSTDPPAPVQPADPDPGTSDPGTTDQTPDDPSAAQPSAPCVDVARPQTRLQTSSRSFAQKHTLRGTAADKGCANSFVARVQVAISLKHGKKCQFVTSAARLGRASSCSKPRWLSAKGTASWSLRLSKRLKHGSYQVLTRAVDSAGNVERAHARRLAISRPR